MNENNANFTPDAPNFKKLIFMNMQKLTNFPYIEADFDALTNYGLLSKVVEYLNEVIANNNEQNDVVEGLYNAYVSLQNYVNDYFDNLDVQGEINVKLDEMARDGTLTNLIKDYVDPIYQAYENDMNENFINLQNTVNNSLEVFDNKIDNIVSGTPIPVSSTSDMTDTTRVYLNTTDGYWYYYDGDSWEQGEVYQASQIANNSIIEPMYKETTHHSSQLFDKQHYFNGYIDSTGVIHENGTSESGLGIYTDFIKIDPYKVQKTFCNHKLNYIYYNSSKEYISGTSSISTTNARPIPENTAYIRCSFLASDLNDIFLAQTDSTNPKTDNYQYSINEVISPKDLLFNENGLVNSKINGYEILSENILDVNSFEVGALTDGGELALSSGTFVDSMTSGYIPVKEETSYYFGYPSSYVCWFDENKQMLGSRILRYAGNQVLSSPENAKYVRITVAKANVKSFAIVETTSSKNIDTYKFNISNLETYRTFPTTGHSVMDKEKYSYNDLLYSKTNNANIIIEKDSVNNDKVIVMNKSLAISSNLLLEYYLKSFKKCCEIEFDVKLEKGATTNNEFFVQINYYDKNGTELNPVSAETRHCDERNETSYFIHKKVRYMIPINCYYVRVVFVARPYLVVSLKNISIKFVDQAENIMGRGLKFVGHQGMPLLAPENTMPSFEYAILAGMDSCVVNVNYTSDGEIVCLHDDTINRTSNGTGNIHTMTYEEALQYDYGSWFNSIYAGTKIPLLEDVLKLFEKSRTDVTIRWNEGFNSHFKEELINLLLKYNKKCNIRIIGFSINTLLLLHEDYPMFKYGYSGYNDVDSTLINQLKQLGDDVLLDREIGYLDESITALAHANNIKVSHWMVNGKGNLNNCLSWGVDEVKTDWFSYQDCQF